MSGRPVEDLARDAIAVCLAAETRRASDIAALLAPYGSGPDDWQELLVQVAAFAVALGERVATTAGEAPAELWRSLALEAARRQP